MVHVHDRERDLDAVRPQLLELEGGHGAGGVLYEDLVHGEVDLLPGDELARRQVPCEYLAGEVLGLGHASLLPYGRANDTRETASIGTQGSANRRIGFGTPWIQPSTSKRGASSCRRR